MSDNRFVSRNLSELQDANSSPIFGYEDSPLLTLEESLAEIIPSIPRLMDYVTTATKKFNRHSSLLTRDEAAAIYLYTMPSTSFFESLNTTLRAEDRHALKPWFPFLKLFITGLDKLPSIKTTVWRGVNFDDTSTFVDGEIHIWWSVNSCSMAPNIIKPYLGDGGTVFAIEIHNGKNITEFSAVPDEQEVVLMPGTHLQCKHDSLPIDDRFFILHLKEVDSQKEQQSKSNYLFDQIKQEYLQNSRLHRLINPSQSFSIEQGYINLVIVSAKDQRDKEKQLHDIQPGNAMMGTYEDVYGVKTAIDVKDILQSCKGDKKQVLVFGRAGIGKSTFCRYIAYQWARGSCWREYELVALIPLRRLTADRYPPNKTYSLVDLVKKEVFSFELSKKEEQMFEEQFDAKKTLWILDGYDEIRGNIPPHLTSLLEHLLNTPHHILTSRPYLNTLSYQVQMEITGFTDKNIEEYVHQFFIQMEEKPTNEIITKDALLRFLQSNRSIWGIAHIPVNLELICIVWTNRESCETQNLTITTLYNSITDWLCRRYLMAQHQDIQTLSEEEVYEHCRKELTFLESLAFHAMENDTIIIQPTLLKKVLAETKLRSTNYSKVLKMGFLKSFRKQTMGDQVELNKDHYFIHLSFQEYFAARYLIRTLNEPSNKDAKTFIIYQKYNQRYALVFHFMAGLVGETNSTSRIETFWNIILGEPLDLVGIRHMQLIISCMDATANDSSVPHHTELVKWIAECIQHQILQNNEIMLKHILQSLRAAESVTNDEIIINMLIDLLQNNDTAIKTQTLSVISELNISNQLDTFISLFTISLDHEDTNVKLSVCEVLGKMGEKAATHEVIDKLVSALSDESEWVRMSACDALGKVGEKAATNEVIDKLLSAFGDESELVRCRACEALGKMGKKAATHEVIGKLVSALGDESDEVRWSAREVLGKMGEKAATNEMIDKLVSALVDENERVGDSACAALGKMGEKAATHEVIDKLVRALGDESERVRRSACEALGKMGEKAATHEVIGKLVSALGDESELVRCRACEALGKMGEKAATHEVIGKLVSALGDESDEVRRSACIVLGSLGEKAATHEVIDKLVSLLGDESEWVRGSACSALGKVGEKAATNEVISKLLTMTNWHSWAVAPSVENAILALLKSTSLLGQLSSGIILECYRSRPGFDILSSIPLHELVNRSVDPNDAHWGLVLSQCAFRRGAAMVLSDDRWVVYDREKPVETSNVSSQWLSSLNEALNIEKKKLHLSYMVHTIMP